jgi:antitoxin ParD1/3/4/toxin ParE1/3/4
VLEAIERAIGVLVEFPQQGHTRSDLTSRPYRFWPVFSYLIVYQPDPPPMRVIRIVHAARDVSPLLRP